MNKDNAALYLPLVQALAAGKTLQARCDGATRTGWDDLTNNVTFSRPPEDYRIKPEPRRFWVRVASASHPSAGAITNIADRPSTVKKWRGDDPDYEIIELTEVLK